MGGQKSSEQSDRELGDLVEELIERAGAATAARILGKILRDEQTVIAQAAETGTVPDYALLDLSDYPGVVVSSASCRDRNPTPCSRRPATMAMRSCRERPSRSSDGTTRTSPAHR
jgi:hypothetical protein